LLPASIDRLFNQDFYRTTNKDTTIGDIIVYIDKLLAGSARALGDTQTLVLKDPPENSHIKCGEFNHGDNVSKLIAHGEFFDFILDWKDNGAINIWNISTENKIKLMNGLLGIVDPQTNHEYMDVANNLLIAIAAQSDITQETAKVALSNICQEIIKTTENCFMETFETMDAEHSAEITELLLQHASSVTNTLISALIVVCSFSVQGAENRAKTIELLRANTSPLFISTLFYRAVEDGHLDLVKVCLEKGVEVNAQDRLGQTALIHACNYGQRDIANLLLEAGAEVNVQDINKFTALMCAARYGERNTVNLLLEKGADMNAEDREGQSALSLAIYNENWYVAW